MFCSNCGTQIGTGVNFCPNCGAKVITVATPSATTAGNMVMLVSLGVCAPATAAALLQQICGYGLDEALLIVDSAPITIARGLSDAQARYLAQALAEYGMEVSVYDGTGWREMESSSTSVWDQTGMLLAGVASALGLLGLDNRISRDMMHRADYPYRYSGSRPPVYQLHTTLRAAPRRVAPTSVRPPVRHAPPPRPAPAPHPAPPRPAPAPMRPAPQPAPRPAARPAPQPAPRPAPQPAARPAPQPAARPAPQPAARPAPRPAPQPAPRPAPNSRPAATPHAAPASRPGGPIPRSGNGNPGSRPGGGAGRKG